MVRIAAVWLLSLCMLAAAGAAAAQGYVAVTTHVFEGPDGAQPQAVAAAPDGSVYGISQNGGSGHGTLFRRAADGSFSVLHAFDGSDGSMQVPSCCSHGVLASLVVAPSGDLYGYTLTGGQSGCQSGYGCGVVFRYAAATGYAVLWKFTGGSDGSAPSGLVYASDGNLYGTSYGFPDNDGAVYKLTTGGVLTVLHGFCSQANCADGHAPDGLGVGPDHNFYGHYHGVSAPDYVYRITPAGVITPLVALLPAIGNNWGDGAANFIAGSDGAMYFTFDSDPYGSGRVDRYDIGRNQLRTLYQFDYTDGDPPYRLTLGSDGTIYGTAAGGGRQGIGTTFRITSPSTLSFLYDFQGQLDGSAPGGIAQLADGRLFGVAAGGGIDPSGCSGCGTLFELAQVPAGAPVVTTFDPGSGPTGTRVKVSGSQFTGTQSMQFGGVDTGFNVQSDQTLVTSVPVGAPTLAQLGIANAAGTGYTTEPFQRSDHRYSVLFAFCPGSPYPDCADGAGPTNLIQSIDGSFYGTTSYNFPSSVLYKVTPAGAQTVLARGLNLPNAIVEVGPYLYGTSVNGGYYGIATGCNNIENPTGCGTLFRVRRSSGALDLLYKFKGLADGAFPRSNVVALGGDVYGSTPGTLFRYRGIGFATVHAFATAGEGNDPAVLIAGDDGNVYGANQGGGAAGVGTVFRYSPATSTLQVLHGFAAAEGKPVGLVRAADGTLFGVTQTGGASNKGSVFRIDTAGVYTTLYSFAATAALGTSPGGIAIGRDGALYGYTNGGGALGGGALFRLNADGSGGTVLYAFFPSNTASSHGYGPRALLQAANGDWYGAAYDGGATSCAFGQGCGVVFRLR
ncbi:MAG: hypothetical protein JSR59_12345 [Proteobacteria bacterium]|nr:hypothetical protein [Pseudomonadota bacterium]